MSSESQNPGLHMVGGSGKDSYSQNSKVQRFGTGTLLDEVEEALQHVRFSSSATDCISVADLCCSSGPNCIYNVKHIVQKLRAVISKHHLPVHSSSSSPVVPFRVFFNDLPDTDFNHLFHLLTAASGETRLADCFVAGVPGSFFDRIFPDSSIHVFFSSWSVHWLSKIPNQVLDKNSPAYNKDSDWLIGATPATIAAFKQQASDDLRCFLRTRAAELVPGGLLFVATGGCADHDAIEDCEGDPNLANLYSMNQAFKQLISKGLMIEETLATINLPIYRRTKQEVLRDVGSCGELFEVKKVEILYRSVFKGAFSDEVFNNSEKLSEAVMAAMCAALGPLVQSHIGEPSYDSFKELLKLEIAKHSVPRMSNATHLFVMSLIRTNSKMS